MKTNQGKQIFKNILKQCLMLLLVCFSALLAVFSVFPKENNLNSLVNNEQIASLKLKNNDDLIIQTPVEDDYWAENLKNDLNNYQTRSFDLKEKIENPFIIAQNTYEFVSVSINLKDANSNRDWRASFVFKSHNSETNQNIFDAFYLDGHTEFSSGGGFFGSSWQEYSSILTLPSLENSSSTSIFGLNLDFSFLGVPSGWTVDNTKLKIESKGNDYASEYKPLPPTPKKEILENFSYTHRGSGILYTNAELPNLNNWVSKIIKELNTIKNPLPNNKINYFSNKKIFFDINALKNNYFSKQELINMIYIYDQNDYLISKNKINFGNVSLDRNRRKINVEIKKISLSNGQWYKHINFSIPLYIVDFNYFLEGSILSTSYWEHLDNGETRYHSKKPQTRVRLSEQMIRAMYIFTHQQQIINKLSSDKEWNFLENDKKVALEKANSNALNWENYNKVKKAYQQSRDVIVLEKLQFDASLNKYAPQFQMTDFNIYLYFIKIANFRFANGINTLVQKNHQINNLYSGLNLKISDDELRKLDKYKTNWTMQVKNFQVTISQQYPLLHSLGDLKFDLPNDVFENYDLKLSYQDASETSLAHSYLFQAVGMDISEQISFVLENGTILDQNYQVTYASETSDLKIGQYGYKEMRYWTTFSNDSQEYVTVIKKGNSFYSPKYQKNIDDLDKNFNLKKIEYLFNQNVQMLISPYQNGPGQPITADTPQSFGIKKVTDTINGSKTILEDWEDGKWSHTHDEDGIALFDGIFGADINGIFDARGRLGEGAHHLQIELQNINFDGLKNDFFISVDKSPSKVNVSGEDAVVDQLYIYDQEKNAYPLFYSNGPIRFQVFDLDLKSVEASLIDQSGNWYKIPVSIKSKKIDDKWMQTINSIINYAGFAKIKIIDSANNEQIVYFWLEQNKYEVTPSFDFDTSLLLDDENRTFKDQDLKIFTANPQLRISSPLATSIALEKSEFINGKWILSSDNDFNIEEYLPENSDDYDFGKTIDSTQSVLNYAGDELKPFLTADNQVAWDVTNKLVTINSPGIYKITMHTRLIDNLLIEKYVYIHDQEMKLINFANSEDEKANFNELPLQDEGDKNNIDQFAKALKKIDINIPQFLITSYQVEFSLLWYSEFLEIFNPELFFTREGKYKITLTNIFGEKYQFNLVILRKDLDPSIRDQLNMVYIFNNHDDQTIEETPFWKGKVIWNYWRYEDEDHAIWEKENFIQKAIDEGLTEDEAEAIYEEAKKDPWWDGNLVNPDGSEYDFEEAWKDYQKNHPELFNPSNNKIKDPTVGIIIGSSIVGSLIIGLFTFLIIKRYKLRKIK